MLNQYVLFNNLFRSRAITPERLYAFGIVVLQALTAANDKDQFTAIIEALTTALGSLQKENADIDTNLTGQKTETGTVDEFMVTFYNYMGENEPFVARQLGGRNSAGYKAFYPFGQSEYSKVTKTTMPTLADRVLRAAVKYKDQLETDLCETLQTFAPDFKKYYTTQQKQIITVKTDRAERTTAFVQAQLTLTSAVGTVVAAYPGDIVKCSSFFPFSMLYPQTKPVVYTLTGKLAAGKTQNLLNQQLRKTATITVKNTGTNASFAVWLAASADEAMPADAKIVTATSAVLVLKTKDLGDLAKNTYFMIKNISDQNIASYEVSFGKLKEAITTVPAEAELIVVTA